MKEDTCEYRDCLYSDESFDESIFRLKKYIHHIDSNHENNDPENLMWMHGGCHTSFHSTGEKHPMFGKHQSDEHKARRVLSCKIGKENYARIKDDLVWDGEMLLNTGEYRDGQ